MKGHLRRVVQETPRILTGLGKGVEGGASPFLLSIQNFFLFFFCWGGGLKYPYISRNKLTSVDSGFIFCSSVPVIFCLESSGVGPAGRGRFLEFRLPNTSRPSSRLGWNRGPGQLFCNNSILTCSSLDFVE